MKYKIKTCGCKHCKADKRRHRKEDIERTKAFNKNIRRQNKEICREAVLTNDKETVNDIIDMSKVSHFWA